MRTNLPDGTGHSFNYPSTGAEGACQIGFRSTRYGGSKQPASRTCGAADPGPPELTTVTKSRRRYKSSYSIFKLTINDILGPVYGFTAVIHDYRAQERCRRRTALRMRDGDVGDHSNNVSLHVRCTPSSCGRPDGCSGRMRAPIFLVDS